MAIKQLKKPVKNVSLNIEKKAQAFINKGGTAAKEAMLEDEDHRLTLRIPNWLMSKVDAQRRKKLGGISRNLFILEAIEKATKNK